MNSPQAPVVRKKENGWVAWLPACALLLASTLALGWLIFSPTDQHERPIIVFFAPWHDRNETTNAVLSAGGSLVGGSVLPFGIIVQSNDPAFHDRLHKAGAWMILDAKGHGLCTTNPDSN